MMVLPAGSMSLFVFRNTAGIVILSSDAAYNPHPNKDLFSSETSNCCTHVCDENDEA